MNRADLAALVLAFNAAWMLTAAGLMTVAIRWLNFGREARCMRNGLLVISGLFVASAAVCAVLS